MTKIFKQLARHWAVCLVVFALLFVQAYCDLSLPDYTSKIVDTGIQQGGIESPLPDTVRQSTLDALSLLMREEDAAAFQNAYTADGDVLRLRTDLTADERTALEDAVTTPDIVLYLAATQAANTPAGQTGMGMTGLADLQASGADRNPDTETETAAPTAEDLDTVCGQFAAMSQMPGFRRDAVQQQLTGAIGQLDDTVVENLKSQALLLVGLEYEAQGIAHAVQMHYLYKVGGQMLALTLLMVAVSIAVGFLASRVSAAIGRDLRRETFSSVIHFSNAEIENFSTASLITRTTNDIQQVQFVCVMLLRMVAYAPILGIGGVLHVIGSSSGLSWIVVLDVALLLLLILFLMNVAMPKFKIMQTLVDRLNLVSREILTGIMPVRAFSREAFEEARFDKANRDLMGTQLFTNRAMVAILDADKEGFLRSETSLIQTIGRAARNAEGLVVLYADTVTPSMKAAITETERRRKKQDAYNKAHGIVPKTVKKSVRELLETGEMVRGIAASRLSLGQVTQSREGAQLLLTAESWLTILYLDEGEQVQCLRKMMPVTCRLDCPEGYHCTCTCTCPGEVFAAPAAGGIEVRFSLDFHCLTVSTFQVAAVEQAKLGEPRTAGEGSRPSVVLRLPVQGEGIWEIAKAYGTTMEEIIQANELEGEELPLGKMLLIPGVR